MEGLIIRDYIKESELKEWLSVFFTGNSVSFFDLEKGVQEEDVLFECIIMRGDFKLELCLYTKLAFAVENLALFICKKFKTEVLISDENVNPYSWVLISETGKLGKVNQVPREDDLFLINRS